MKIIALIFSLILATIQPCSADVLHGYEVSSVTVVDYTQDANCMGAWYMNGSANGTETDRSGNSNTLSNNNSVGASSSVPSGYSGNSRDFESSESDYLSRVDGGTLNISGVNQPITISAWVYRESDTGGFEVIVSKYDFGNDNRQYQLLIDNNDKASFIIVPSGTSVGTGTSIGATSIPIATWTHIVGVYRDDGAGGATDQIEVYVDGVLDTNGASNPKTYDSGIFNGSSIFAIGVNFGSGSPSTDFFDGPIDELIVFDRSVTVDEITDIYQDGISGNKGGND